MSDPQVDLEAVFARVLESARGSEMTVRLGQSLEVTDGLWELVPIVVAAAEAHERRPPAQVANSSAAAKGLTAERRASLRSLGETFRSAMAGASAGQRVDESALEGLTAAEIAADPFGVADTLMDTPGYIGAVLSSLGAGFFTELAGMSADEAAYLGAYLQAGGQQWKAPALLRAIFAAAVATVEPLVTRMVQLLLFEAAPDSYTSLADPELDSKARNLCFGPPAKWRATLTGTLEVTALADIVDWDGLGLLWEARNVIAHRGGVADLRYHQQSDAEVGSVVASEPEKVRAAIDEIGAARFAIVCGVWEHLAPGIGAEIAESVGMPITNSLRTGRWRQAAGLARIGEAFALDSEAVATAKVNKWLAIDQGHGPGAIRDAVETWDTTALPPVYGMARHLLLRQDDEALAVLRELTAAGTLTPADLASWPLFDRARLAGLLSDLTGPAEEKAVTGAITEERFRKLVDLAVDRIREAERCAEAGCYPAACLMAGAGTEAAIMAHACVRADEVRAAGRWQETRSAPFDWTFERLIQTAVAMGWLPATRTSLPSDQAVDKLAGEVGDAVRFVQFARNLVAHPGKHVMETPWLSALGEDEYSVVYGVTRQAIDHLHAALSDSDGRT